MSSAVSPALSAEPRLLSAPITIRFVLLLSLCLVHHFTHPPLALFLPLSSLPDPLSIFVLSSSLRLPAPLIATRLFSPPRVSPPCVFPLLLSLSPPPLPSSPLLLLTVAIPEIDVPPPRSSFSQWHLPMSLLHAEDAATHNITKQQSAHQLESNRSRLCGRSTTAQIRNNNNSSISRASEDRLPRQLALSHARRVSRLRARWPLSLSLCRCAPLSACRPVCLSVLVCVVCRLLCLCVLFVVVHPPLARLLWSR